MALFIQGCQLGQDDEEEDVEADIFTVAVDYYDDTITNDSLYEVKVQSNFTDIILKDDISEITIYGSDNQIEIDSDTAIDKISITGSRNIFTVKIDVDLTVTQLTIVGDNNSVTLFDVTSPVTDSGTDNLVCENNICS